MTEIERTVPLRILKAKKVTVNTLAGKVFFFLKKDEYLPFSRIGGITVRPKAMASLFGAFVDTKALSGVAVFSLTLNRIGNVFGKRYYDKIISVIFGTAEGIADTLSYFNLAVPKAAALITAFVCAAWLFSLLKNSLKYAHFRLTKYGKRVTVRYGVITLREYTLALDNLNAAVISNSFATLLFKKAPVYAFDKMIFPAVSYDSAEKIIRGAFGIKITREQPLKPPKKALFGHIAVPFWWSLCTAAALLLTYAAENIIKEFSFPLLKSLLWIGTAISLWYCLLFGIYMKRSELAFGKHSAFISSRRGARLDFAYIPRKSEVSYTLGVNIFQKRNGLCDFKINCIGRRFVIRNIGGIKPESLLSRKF